ncbi:hypothetical protein [Bacillus sp. NPDC077027]|uniref:hypothetical protein n=1 Tax=Bacillus sp. NPDC077027 TaxID=3390548 RepID=UPI003D06A895
MDAETLVEENVVETNAEPETSVVEETSTTETQSEEKVVETTETPETKVDPENEPEENSEVTDSEQEPEKEEEIEPLQDEAKEKDKLTGQIKKEQGKVDALKDQVKSLESVVQTILDTKMKGVPEELHGLIPEGDLVSRLEWINKAEQSGIFNKQEKEKNPNVEIGKPLELNQKNAKDVAKLSPQQKMANYFGNLYNK